MPDPPIEDEDATPDEAPAKEPDGSKAEDLASPEAIARRVAALGGDEDESDRAAAAEEVKLAERLRKQKKKKKGGLEAAASKKLAKIGGKAPVRSSSARAIEADAFSDRAAKIGEWAKKNQSVVAIAAGAVVLLGIGAAIYAYVDKKHEMQASVELAKAMDDEHGRIGDPDKEDDEDHPHDPRPVFRTLEARRDAALREYKDVASKFKGTGAGILAQLAEGSILLDKHDVAGALGAYGEVSASPLAKADAEVHGRALEGTGFAYELKAESEQGDAAHASLEEAGKTYRELENIDVLGFAELAMYHQARVLEKEGDKEKAIELLKKLHGRLDKAGEARTFVYLQAVADDRLRALDPSAVPSKSESTSQKQFSDAQIRKILEQMKQKRGEASSPGEAPSGLPPMPPQGLPH